MTSSVRVGSSRSHHHSKLIVEKNSEQSDPQNQSLLDPDSPTNPFGSSQGSEALFRPNVDERANKDPRFESGRPFEVNKAVRDSRDETAHAKQTISVFDRLEDVMAKMIEESKQLSRQISRAGDAVHKTVLDVPALGAISGSLSTLRESLVSGNIADKAAAAHSTNVALPGRSDHILNRLANSEQRRRTPTPLTFNDVDIRSTIAVARGDLGEIGAHLHEIEARLTAQCSISPFANGESLSHLDKLRFIKSQIETVDAHLRDVGQAT